MQSAEIIRMVIQVLNEITVKGKANCQYLATCIDTLEQLLDNQNEANKHGEQNI